FTEVEGAERVLLATLLASEAVYCHRGTVLSVEKKPPPNVGQRSEKTTPHIFQTSVCWNWHLPRPKPKWLPGFHRASPSTPLDVAVYVRATIPSQGPRAQIGLGR